MVLDWVVPCQVRTNRHRELAVSVLRKEMGQFNSIGLRSFEGISRDTFMSALAYFPYECAT